MPDNRLIEVPIDGVWKLKYPEQIVLATARAADGRTSIIPLGWYMQVSGTPPMVAIAVGLTRFSHDLIAQSGEFVVCFPSTEMASEVLYCGSHSGRDVDKFAATGLKAVPASVVGAPLIEGCVACLECRVTNSLVTGDHRVFVGEVVAAHASEQPLRRLYNYGDLHFGGAEFVPVPGGPQRL